MSVWDQVDDPDQDFWRWSEMEVDKQYRFKLLTDFEPVEDKRIIAQATGQDLDTEQTWTLTLWERGSIAGVMKKAGPPKAGDTIGMTRKEDDLKGSHWLFEVWMPDDDQASEEEATA